MGFDVVAFDLDGTLADTSADLADALNHALESFGRLRLPLDQITLMVGHGTRALMRKGLTATGGDEDALLEDALSALTGFYENNICRHTAAYAGAGEALDALRAVGIRTAICTNKPERLTKLLVEALGWSGKFDAVIGGDTLAVSKPDAAPLLEAISQCGGGRALYVGDSITDADTARAANIPFVAVSFGFRDRPVDALGADAVIDHFRDLNAVVKKLANISAAAPPPVSADARPVSRQ
jgi:phosphoglycolate phosphatase